MYRQCVAITKKGDRCLIGAEPGIDLCHIHDPAETYLLQHPPTKKVRKPRVRATAATPSRPFKEPMAVPVGALTVYTDGACQPTNPGPGGWGWTAQDGREGSGGARWTTNQRMEICAALMALRSLDGPLLVTSDSMYVVQCFRDGWWRSWAKRGWMRGGKKNPQPVKNRDMWEPLVDLYREREHEVAFAWVRGHSGVAGNERADELATRAAQGVLA